MSGVSNATLHQTVPENRLVTEKPSSQTRTTILIVTLIAGALLAAMGPILVYCAHIGATSLLVLLPTVGGMISLIAAILLGCTSKTPNTSTETTQTTELQAPVTDLSEVPPTTLRSPSFVMQKPPQDSPSLQKDSNEKSVASKSGAMPVSTHSSAMPATPIHLENIEEFPVLSSDASNPPHSISDLTHRAQSETMWSQPHPTILTGPQPVLLSTAVPVSATPCAQTSDIRKGEKAALQVDVPPLPFQNAATLDDTQHLDNTGKFPNLSSHHNPTSRGPLYELPHEPKVVDGWELAQGHHRTRHRHRRTLSLGQKSNNAWVHPPAILTDATPVDTAIKSPSLPPEQAKRTRASDHDRVRSLSIESQRADTAIKDPCSPPKRAQRTIASTKRTRASGHHRVRSLSIESRRAEIVEGDHSPE